MSATRRSSALCIAALVALTSACGTTVRAPLERPAGDAPELGLPPAASTSDPFAAGHGAPAAAGTAGADGVAEADVVSGVRAPAGVERSSASRAGAGQRRTTPSRTLPADGGPSVRIGFAYQKDVGPYAAALGFDVDPGDYLAAARAVVDDLNAHGGVLGRRLLLVPEEDKTAASAAQPSTAAQQMCERLTTEDGGVDVAISAVAAINIPQFFGCLAARRTPVVILDPNPHGLEAEFRAFSPYVYHPASVALERLAPVWVDRLRAQGWFGGWDTEAGAPGTAPMKVAVAHQQNAAYSGSLTRALRRHGVAPPLELTYSSPGDAAAKMRGFVLRMKADGVTHVFVDKAITTMLMTVAAEDQGYRPRYGLSTFNGPTPGLARQRAVPKVQLRGSAGVGFVPLADVQDPRPFLGAGSPAARCEAVTRAAGVVPQTDLARLYQHLVCDALWQLVDGWRLGGAVDPRSLQNGMQARPAARGASTLLTRYGRDRHDGAGAVRDFAWSVECTCFRYGRVQAPT